MSDNEREQPLKFALTEANIDCMTLGEESIAQLNDTVNRVMNQLP